MTDALFRELHHAKVYKNTMAAHERYARTRVRRFRQGGNNQLTAQRLHYCYRLLQDGRSWSFAVRDSMVRFPI
jgi:hypothetical protein